MKQIIIKNKDETTKCLKEGDDMTSREIADKTGIEISRVSGCLNSLQKYQIVVKVNQRVRRGNQQVHLWRYLE